MVLEMLRPFGHRRGKINREPLEDLTIDNASHRPSEQMMAEARARANAPRSLTSWVMGDPPPGMSALDKRRPSHACEG